LDSRVLHSILNKATTVVEEVYFEIWNFAMFLKDDAGPMTLECRQIAPRRCQFWRIECGISSIHIQRRGFGKLGIRTNPLTLSL